MVSDGHLDCMFDCGLSFSSLEALYLHVELDHREDTSISPFAVQRFAKPLSPSSFQELPPPPPSPPRRPPPPHPVQSGSEVAEETRTPRRKKKRRHATYLRHDDGAESDTADDRGETHGGTDGLGEEAFMLCPDKRCDELILIAELNEHLDLHDAERASIDEVSSGKKASAQSSSSSSSASHLYDRLSSALRQDAVDRPRKREDDSSRIHITRRMLSALGMEKKSRRRSASKSTTTGSKRLGTAELGPYAYEDKMPQWMLKRLKEGPKTVRTRRIARNGSLVTHETVDGHANGVIPILHRLLDLDENTERAYLCSPAVTQIGRTTWESGFCGFRNTQMLISYLQNSRHPASTVFPAHVPGILDLQDWIENAWSEGINAHARAEFAGLRGTRKWIGTLEVTTLLDYLGIPHQTHQFHDTWDEARGLGAYAEQNLLNWVESYFASSLPSPAPESMLSRDRPPKLLRTTRPPIYFQRPGHSLTIVGIERLKSGQRNLLVFDPMYQLPASMLQLIDRGLERIRDPNERLLRCYRRSQYRIQDFADFEAVTVEDGGDRDLVAYGA